MYLFGMLPATVGNTKFTNYVANLTLHYDVGKSCLEKQGLGCKYVGVSQWRPDSADTLWYSAIGNMTEGKRKQFSLFPAS